MEVLKKKRFYMLCGVPGSGKSTWVQSYKSMWQSHETIHILSTDDIIEAIAKRQGLTYNDVFGDVSYAFAERMMHKLASIAFDRADTVIWDQTNLNPKTRARKLVRVPEGWSKVAIAFGVPDDLQDRLASREGKTIPPKIVEGMIRNYKKPTEEEGFDHIITIGD